MKCFHCQKDIFETEKPSFRETCPFCSEDAHVCLNCRFYDQGAYNECKESSADRVTEKNRANFCEYFQMGSEAKSSDTLSEAELAKKKLEEMFK